MDAEQIKQKIHDIRLPHHAEHVGFFLLSSDENTLEELRPLYFSKLQSMEMLGFLGKLLSYAGRLLDDGEVLIWEEQMKVQSLLESIEVLSEGFQLEYDENKHALYRRKLRDKYNL